MQQDFVDLTSDSGDDGSHLPPPMKRVCVDRQHSNIISAKPTSPPSLPKPRNSKLVRVRLAAPTPQRASSTTSSGRVGSKHDAPSFGLVATTQQPQQITLNKENIMAVPVSGLVGSITTHQHEQCSMQHLQKAQALRAAAEAACAAASANFEKERAQAVAAATRAAAAEQEVSKLEQQLSAQASASAHVTQHLGAVLSEREVLLGKVQQLQEEVADQELGVAAALAKVTELRVAKDKAVEGEKAAKANAKALYTKLTLERKDKQEAEREAAEAAKVVAATKAEAEAALAEAAVAKAEAEASKVELEAEKAGKSSFEVQLLSFATQLAACIQQPSQPHVAPADPHCEGRRGTSGSPDTAHSLATTLVVDVHQLQRDMKQLQRDLDEEKARVKRRDEEICSLKHKLDRQHPSKSGNGHARPASRR